MSRSNGIAQANGLQLHWESSGADNSDVVVLIMGLGCQLIQWPDELCDALVERGFRVIRFDNRDIGLSSEADHGVEVSVRAAFLKTRLGLAPGPANYHLTDMAADVVGLMDALDISAAHIVGASMGGMIAQLTASIYPDRVRTLTSIMSGTNHPRIRQTRLDLMWRLASGPPSLERQAIIERQIETFRLISSPKFPTPLDERRAFFERAFDRSFRPSGSRRQLHAIVTTASLEAWVRKIRVPTQIIHGTDDPLMRPVCGQRSAELIPDARLELIQGMGHDCPVALMPRWADLIAENAKRAL